MATVTMIPAKSKVGARAKSEDAPKLRVAAYCRVSTDTDEQATSYDAQIEHYTDYIGKHPGWELAGIYADDGISGTNTKKRKSISRFARNTLDCLKYIRQLKDKNIAVFFEKEAINTLDAKGEVLLTIMASLAQQESQSLSQNVRLGLQYRYQQGKVQVCTNRFLGYDKDEDGNLVINPEEAEVVRRIYREYLSGKSYYQIGQELSADVQNAVDSTNAAAESVKAQDILIRETADTFEEIGENVGNLIGRFNDIGTSIEAIGRSATEINNNIASLAATSEQVASLSSMGEEGARTAVEKFDEFDILLKGIYDQAQRLK